jgi:hypothetical protein
MVGAHTVGCPEKKHSARNAGMTVDLDEGFMPAILDNVALVSMFITVVLALNSRKNLRSSYHRLIFICIL